jgi:DNA ligase (NAD+)
VAELQPVSLAGSVIRHATLHNASEIARRDLRIGDTVVLEKAGEVIPAVLAAVPELRPQNSTPYQYPDRCPACSSVLVRIAGEVAYRCLNPDCPPQISRRLAHFASKSALDIASLGPQRIEQLLQSGLVRHFADIFRLTAEQLISLPRSGEKLAQRLLHGIEEAKTRPLWRLVHGLGIPHVGAETAKELARSWPSMSLLMNADEADFRQCDGIGDIVAASISQFFQNANNRKLVEELEGMGLGSTVVDAVKIIHHERFFGKNFAITGSFAQFTREELKRLIEQRGGTVRAALSGKIDFLLCGENPGSKIEEAQRTNVQIIDAQTLLAWLSGNF